MELSSVEPGARSRRLAPASCVAFAAGGTDRHRFTEPGLDRRAACV